MLTGRQMKRINASIALLFLPPAAVLAAKFPLSAMRWLLWFLVGLLWANWFEYAYHRWADHKSGSYFERAHRVHHAKPKDERNINLGETGLTTFVMFLVNGGPAILLDGLWLHSGFSAPLLAAFVFYVLAIEEIHWRVHTGGWIPFHLGRRYHLEHHARPTTRFNICVPLFDWIFGTTK